MTVRNARVLGTGMLAPERVVPNAWFDEQLGENVSDWLVENLTIRERRWCGADESTADLSEKAARAALERAGVSAEELDLIILATDTPEYVSPATSTVVQHRIGARNAGCFDLNAACSGFVAALDTGAKMIRADERMNKVLVIGAYAMSKYLDLEDKKTVTLFADGAGAVVLGLSEEEGNGWLGSRLHDDDVVLFEMDHEKDFGLETSAGLSVHYLRDHANGEGGVSILGQGLNSGLSDYNGVFNFDLGGEEYEADVFWLGTHAHQDPLLAQGRFGWSGFAFWNVGQVQTANRTVDISGLATLHGGYTQDVAEKGVAALPNADLEIVPECGHFVQFERPDVVNPVVLEFLRRN